MKFDIIIGNPPYQDANSKSPASKYWVKFIEAFQSSCRYLMFVTPDPWTHPYSNKSKYKKLFRENQLVAANVGECAKHFPGIGSSFTYFLLEMVSPHSPTKLTTKEGEVSISFPSTPWIPNKVSKDSLELLQQTLWSDSPKIQYVDSQLPKEYHSKGQTPKFQYPFQLSTSTISWREVKCKYQDSPKVMFPYLASHTKPILDLGTLGATHGLNLIFQTNEEAIKAFEFYSNSTIQEALSLSKWHHGNANPQVLKSLPLFSSK